jgi:hypothetical protein
LARPASLFAHHIGRTHRRHQVQEVVAQGLARFRRRAAKVALARADVHADQLAQVLGLDADAPASSASTRSLTALTPNTVSCGSALMKRTLLAPRVPAWRRRSATMKLILSGAPAHLSGPAGSVINASPPFLRKASMACQLRLAASGLG